MMAQTKRKRRVKRTQTRKRKNRSSNVAKNVLRHWPGKLQYQAKSKTGIGRVSAKTNKKSKKIKKLLPFVILMKHK